jgi:Ran GTPase-activating protein (RanGAP) involved in mRNA processing and transport
MLKCERTFDRDWTGLKCCQNPNLSEMPENVEILFKNGLKFCHNPNLLEITENVEMLKSLPFLAEILKCW